MASASEPAASVTFAELAWAHFNHSREERDGEPHGAWEAEFQRRLAAFEASEGAVVRVFWGVNLPVGVALTARVPHPTRQTFGLGSTRFMLHRATEGIRLPAQVEGALFEGDLLAVKATGVLRGASQAIVLDRVMSAQTYVLSLIDANKGRIPDPAPRENLRGPMPEPAPSAKDAV